MGDNCGPICRWRIVYARVFRETCWYIVVVAWSRNGKVVNESSESNDSDDGSNDSNDDSDDSDDETRRCSVACFG